MKSNTIRFLFIALFFCGWHMNYAQERLVNKAADKYESLNYINAQEVYLKVAEKGFESSELFAKLGNSYYFNAEYEQAAHWYGRLFSFQAEQEEALLYLRYAQALKATHQPEKAADYYQKFQTKSGKEIGAIPIDYAKLIEENSGRYEVQLLQKIASPHQITYGHAIKDSALVYTSTHEQVASFFNRIDAWDGLSYMVLYKADIDSLNRIIGTPQQMGGIFDSKFHDASAVFTDDGKTVYFTRSNMSAEDKEEAQYLKIYRSTYEDEEWQEPVELSINGNSFSTAHPALSPDETKLYFASDRPGGFGQSDLYVVNIRMDGSLDEPQNLGSAINTPGRETFPFVSQDHELYFSSDGYFGLGGLDVFYIKINDDGTYGHLLNVGKPVNSYADDFSFGINEETQYGFFSSNRETTKDTGFVKSNIYSFKEIEPIKDLYKAIIEGHVTDKHTGEPIAGVTITLRNQESGEVYATVTTDEEGYYKVETNKFEVYRVRAEKAEYDTAEKLSEAGLARQEINFELQRNVAILTPGTDLAKALNIPIIHFDFDKSNIRPDAQVQLAKVIAVMKKHPLLKIQIRSHTDSRGSDAYNEALSDRRAKSTRDYMIAHGISPDRLTAKGFGEYRLVNECSNGVPCTEAQHQANRRSEFIVVE